MDKNVIPINYSFSHLSISFEKFQIAPILNQNHTTKTVAKTRRDQMGNPLFAYSGFNVS